MLGEYLGSGTGTHEGLALGFLMGFLGFLPKTLNALGFVVGYRIPRVLGEGAWA